MISGGETTWHDPMKYLTLKIISPSSLTGENVQMICRKNKNNSDKKKFSSMMNEILQRIPDIPQIPAVSLWSGTDLTLGICAFVEHFATSGGGIQVEAASYVATPPRGPNAEARAAFACELTAAACVVVLVGAGRTGSQACAALGAQQGQRGATRLALQAAGTGGAGRVAGWGRREGDAVKSSLAVAPLQLLPK